MPRRQRQVSQERYQVVVLNPGHMGEPFRSTNTRASPQSLTRQGWGLNMGILNMKALMLLKTNTQPGLRNRFKRSDERIPGYLS